MSHLIKALEWVTCKTKNFPTFVSEWRVIRIFTRKHLKDLK